MSKTVHVVRWGPGSVLLMGLGAFALGGAALFWPLGVFHGAWAVAAQVLWLVFVAGCWTLVGAARAREARDREDPATRAPGPRDWAPPGELREF